MLLKAILSSLVCQKDDVVIMDMEAGLEHLGRGTASCMDQFIVVIEPGARSIQTYERIKTLAKDIGVSVKEADAFLKNYLAAFPKVSGYMDKTIADAKAVGYVSTLFGRRRALPELASSNFNVRSSGERMARNTPIQGTAADVIKLAMVRVWKRLRDEKMESRLILTVHDELIVEAPQAEAEKAAQILREEMEGCVQYAVPLSTDVHAGKNWLEAH